MCNNIPFDLQEDENDVECYLEDGFGNYFHNKCQNCGAEVEIVRPGKVQCSEGCW